jgi:hypothetical protein
VTTTQSRSYAFLWQQGWETFVGTAVVSESFGRQQAFSVLGRLLVVCAFLSGCAGDRQAQTTSQQAATGKTPAIATASGVTTTPVEASEEPSDDHALWSLRKLVRTLAGSRIHVEGRIVRLDGGTLTCSGEGDGRQRGGVRVWTEFSCIQPTFPPGQLVGPDALFRVQVGTATLLVREASFSRYPYEN